MALTELQVARLVEKYLREYDRFHKMAALVAQRLSSELFSAAIPHVPTFRAKSPESLQSKLARKSADLDYQELEREFSPSIRDLAGVRVLLYRPQDAGPTCDIISQLFLVPDGERFSRDYPGPRYHASHRIVSLGEEELSAEDQYSNLRGVLCEVQVVTLVDHIWNELEHDILYKTPDGKASSVQEVHLRHLRRELDVVSATVAELMEATENQRLKKRAAIDTPEDLSDALRAILGRRVHGDFGLLLRLLQGALSSNLSPLTLENLNLAPAALEPGSEAAVRLDEAGVKEPDDVGLLVSHLWPAYGAEFVLVSRRWVGRPSRLARLIQALDRAGGGVGSVSDA